MARWIHKPLTLALALAIGSTAACSKEEKKAEKEKPAASAKAKDAKDDGDAKSKKKAEKADEKKTKAASADAKPAAATGGAAAHAHLHAGCEVVARVDIKRLLSAETMKKHVVPALEEAKKAAAAKDAAKDNGGFTAFLNQVGLNPTTDLDELAVCVSNVKKAQSAPGGKPDFGVALGGKFKKDSVLAALKKTAKKERKLVDVEVSGLKAVTDDKKEMYLAQAADGVVLMSSNEAELGKINATSTAAVTEFKLPMDRALALVVPKKTVAEAMKDAGPNNPFSAHAKNAGRAAITADMHTGSVEFRIDMTTEKGAIELGGFVKMMLAEMQKKPPRDPMGQMAMGVLKDAKVDNKGSELVVSVVVPKDKLEELAKAMGEGIRKEIKTAK